MCMRVRMLAGARAAGAAHWQDVTTREPFGSIYPERLRGSVTGTTVCSVVPGMPLNVRELP